MANIEYRKSILKSIFKNHFCNNRTFHHFAWFVFIQIILGTSPHPASASSIMDGKSINFYGESKSKMCFNNGVCNWGNWNFVFLKAYFSKNGKIYVYRSKKKVGEVVRNGELKDDMIIRTDGDKIYNIGKFPKMTINNIFTVRRKTCKVKIHVKFANGNGRIVRTKWRKKRCSIHKGNPF